MMPSPRPIQLGAARSAHGGRRAVLGRGVHGGPGAEQREALERAERDVDEVLSVQAEVEAEQAKLRDLRKQRQLLV